MRPRFVYFDLDDTLLDHRRAERAALADVYRRHSACLGAQPLEAVCDTYRRHNAPLWRDYAAGAISNADLKRLRFARTLDAPGVRGLCPEALSDAYLEAYGTHWTWTPGAEAAFEAIAARFPVGLLTNGFAEQQRAKLARFPRLARAARAVVISEEVGAMKPDPALFAHAARCAGVPPEGILYVGDALHSDVDGARAAGWQVAWYRGDADLRPGVFTFDAWPSLLRVLLGEGPPA
ncbi:MAG: HAD family hydrolase [Rubricoccaceae bacterium]